MEHRTVLPTLFGRICPITTPESERIGLTLQLARRMLIDNYKRPLSSYQGRKGSLQQYNLHVAEEVDCWIGERWPDNVNEAILARHLHPDGTLSYDYKTMNELDYILVSADQWLSYGAALIPFLQHNDTVRTVMAAKALKEALPLVEPEEPIVTTGSERAVLEGAITMRSRTVSPVTGQISAITADSIHVTTDNGMIASVPLFYGSEPAKASAVVQLRPTVTVGALISAGEQIADGPGMRNGKLALGVNLLVAYLPFEGLNFEDAIVISASAARRLTSDHRYIIESEVPCFSYVSDHNQLQDGLIAEGTRVHGGMVLAIGRPMPTKGSSHKSPHADQSPVILRAPSDIICGYISRVVLEQGILRIEVSEEKPVAVGDKIAGRHGNKGIIARILADEDLPWFEVAGQRHSIEVILNPHGVLSRMNLGQLLETHWSWVLQRSGEQGTPVGKPFNVIPPTILQERLLASGLDAQGKAHVYSGRTGEAYHQPIVIGYQYFVKLPQIAAGKLSVRGKGKARNLATEQPTAGRHQQGGQRIGEMEFWSFLAHKAFINAQEALSPKADDLQAAGLLFQGGNLPERYNSETLHALQQFLGAGLIHLTMSDHKNGIASTVRLLSANEVCAQSSGVVMQDTVAIDLPNSLGSQNIFGTTRAERRIRTGHILLAAEVVHPWGWSHLREELLAISKDKEGELPLTKRLLQSYWYGQQYDAAGRTGSAAIIPLLKEYLPETLWRPWVFEVLPVLPPAYRMIIDWRYPPPVVRAYQQVLRANQYVQRLKYFEPEMLQEVLSHKASSLDTFDRSERLLRQRIFHPRSPNDIRLREYWQQQDWSNLLIQVQFDSMTFLHNTVRRLMNELRNEIDGKGGLLRQGLLGRRVDYSGRAVLVPAPDLAINQCYLPLEIACQFVDNEPDRLMNKVRIARRQSNAVAIKRLCAEIQEAIERDATWVVLNRQPTLHPHNLIAFSPRVWEYQAIGLPPLYCGPMNADFDGDTIAVYCPVSQEAQQEAKEVLDIRRHVTSRASGQLILHLAQDIVLGAFYLSLPDKELKIEEWKKEQRFRFAAELGTVPEEIQNLDKKELQRLADRTMQLYGPVVGLERIQRATTLAFDAATQSGISLSFFDLESLIVAPDKRMQWQQALDAGEVNTVREWLEHDLRPAVAHANPAALLYLSGARGSWEQMAQLIALKGQAYDEFMQPLHAPPIKHNLYEGLSPFEYLQTCHTARRTLVDKKIVVGQAGAMTRDLVESSYAIRLVPGRCSGSIGIPIPLARALGRVLAQPIDNIPVGTHITPEILTILYSLKAKDAFVQVLSPATCTLLTDTVCQECYGAFFPNHQPAEPGSYIGLIAALAIGERGTQLSMQTFHSGGMGGSLDIDGARKLLLRENPSFDFASFWAVVYGAGSPYQQIDPRHFETVLRSRLITQTKLLSARQVASNSAVRGFLAVASYRYGVSTFVDAVLTKKQDSGTGVKKAILLANTIGLSDRVVADQEYKQ